MTLPALHDITAALALHRDQAEAAMLQLPQVECRVVHHFAPGIAIREVRIPAGTLAIGHRQKFPQANMMLKGRVLLVGENGAVAELVAPLFYVGPPGRKIGYVLEDVVWQNIFATDITDPEALEAEFLEKSEAWQENADELLKIAAVQREADRLDFNNIVALSGFTHDRVQEMSESGADQVPFPTMQRVFCLADAARRR